MKKVLLVSDTWTPQVNGVVTTWKNLISHSEKQSLVFELPLILFILVNGPEAHLVHPLGPTASLCFATFAAMTTKTTTKKTTKKTTTTDEEE